jgi:hypothetical protein
MSAADPKPSFVERLFAEHRAALQTFCAGWTVDCNVACGGISMDRSSSWRKPANGIWPPAKAVAVDAERATAWLHRQIAFEHEPLEKVAAEFNRYAPKPIEIVTPGLQRLEISGVFTTDDPAAFIAFLRSMEGVQVEETATRFRVSRD